MINKLCILLVLITFPLLAQTDTDSAKAGELFEKGYSAIDAHEYGEAIKLLKEAVKLDKSGECGSGKKGLAYNEIGYAYFMKDDEKSALEYYNLSLKINPNLIIAYVNRANSYEKMGKTDKAIEDLTACIKLAPDYSPAYAQRGLYYQNTKKIKLAVQDYKKAIELEKNAESGISKFARTKLAECEAE